MLIVKIKKSKMFKPAVTGLIVLILIGAGIYAYTQYQPEEEKEEIPIKETYDGVGPNTLQSISFTLHRIRKKGIINQMENSGLFPNIFKNLPIKNQYIKDYLEGMRPGFGWDEKPSFTFTSTIDDEEWLREKPFNDWDTGYINEITFVHVEDEQPTAYVDFTIIEHQTQKKLLGSTTIKKEMDSFKVTYDFRTGRWTGDDEFNDTDGYGHYDGENYEIWFTLSQFSEDGDKIPYWTEVNILDTDPTVDDSKLDPDNDGIPTEWEWYWGYDPFVYDNHSTLDPDLDGLQNTEEYFMRKYLANPYHGEIYIEVDWSETPPFKPYKIEMQQGKILPIQRPTIVKTNDWGMDCSFWEESQQMIMDRFSEHNITVMIDDGCIDTGGTHGGGEIFPIIGGDGKSSYDGATGYFSKFYNTKFDDDRKGIFRYLIITHTGGYTYNMNYGGCYDTIVLQKYPKFFKGVNGNAVVPRTQRIGQAVAVMHEMGHTCGMAYEHCGGVDNFLDDGTWDNYQSCMNYVKYGQRLFDYSDGTHGENDADDWGSLYLGHFQITDDELEGVGFDPVIYGRPRG